MVVVCHPTDITHVSRYLNSGFSVKCSYQLECPRQANNVHTPNFRVQRAQFLFDPFNLVVDGLHHLGAVQRDSGHRTGANFLEERAFLDGTRDVIATCLMRRIVGEVQCAEDRWTGVSRHVDESGWNAKTLEFESSLENSQRSAPTYIPGPNARYLGLWSAAEVRFGIPCLLTECRLSQGKRMGKTMYHSSSGLESIGK